MIELSQLTTTIRSQEFKKLPRKEQRELTNKQQTLIKAEVKNILKEHLEPLLMEYDLDSDIRIFNDGDDGIKIEFVEYWSDVDCPGMTKESTPKVIEQVPLPPTESLEQKPFLEHKLDWSPFLYGFTIDSKYHDAVNKAVGKVMTRSETVFAKLLIDNECFDIKIDNPDVKSRKDHIMRMLYKGKGHTAGEYLQKVFAEAYSYLKHEKEIYGGKHQVKLPEHLQGMLSIYTTDEPLVFRMKYKKQ